MTIAAGFVYADGVFLFADSQFTVGASKIDGLKLGRFEASWGQVESALAGNVDYAAAAFQRCEREKESEAMCASPLQEIERILEGFYRRHVFRHPNFETEGGGLEYSLLLAIRLNAEGVARLYRTQETVLREVQSFDCIGSGEDSARDLLRFLYRSRMSLAQSVALSAYVLSHVKVHVDGCGGKSVAQALDSKGFVDQINSIEFQHLGGHIENIAPWFVCEAQQFMLGHMFGDREAFEKRCEIFRTRMLHMRSLWEARTATQASPQQTKAEPIYQPPWPESPGGSGES